MPALYGVGLTYLWKRAVRGPQSVDKVESTFFFAQLKMSVLTETDKWAYKILRRNDKRHQGTQ